MILQSQKTPRGFLSLGEARVGGKRKYYLRVGRETRYLASLPRARDEFNRVLGKLRTAEGGAY